MKKEELAQRLKTCTTILESRKKIKAPSSLANEIKELEFRKEIIQESIKNIEKDMLTSHIFSDFLKEHKMEGLDSFRSV